MAKNIVIAEGATAKSFTAKKIQTKAQDNGTVNWIPEDEAVDYVRLVDKEFTANGTYDPDDYNADGFGEVKVNIPADVKEKAITANGEFYAADDGVLGYSKVVVSVPGGGGGGPFTVRFFDDDRQTILKTDANVPYGGSASCTELDGTIINGQYFKGWNPSPTNVKENMNCYPLRGEIIIDANEILDSWETICADGGAHYPLGSYKALVLNNAGGTFERYNGSSASAVASTQFHMVKVGEGEDGSTSSWISTGLLNFVSGHFGSGYRNKWSETPNNTNPPGAGWRTSDMRAFLSQSFFEGVGEQYPILKDKIKTVTKYSYDFVTDNAGSQENTDMETVDRIWVPSEREWKTIIEANGQSMRFTPVHYGIDYSAVYVPSYSALFSVIWTRDMFSNETTSRRKNCARYMSNWSQAGTECANTWGGIPIGFCL